MGKIKSDMEELVNEIRSSASARHAGVKHIRDDARSLLMENERERGERARTLAQGAKALSTKLERQSQDRLKAARGLKDALGRTAESRKAAIRQGRSQMHHRLDELHMERRKTADELKQSVQADVGGIRDAVGVLRKSVRRMMGDIGADVREAGRLWRRGPVRVPPPRRK
jgi:DNA anti-recombination protein RmuC